VSFLKKLSISFFSVFLFLVVKTPVLAETVGPYLQAVTKNSVYVMVESYSQSPITVQYGQTTGYGMTSQTESFGSIINYFSGSVTSYIHKIKLSGLSPDTPYHYRVSQGQDYSFRTAPSEGTPFRFAWMSDIQAADSTARAIAEQIARQIKTFSPRFSLYGGDLANDSYRFKTDFFLPRQKALIAEVPFFLTWGNHDVSTQVPDVPNFTNVASFTRAPDSASNSQQYYSFDYGNLHVLVLNYNINHSVGSPQYIFAQNDLASTRKKWKIVISHAPAYGYIAGGGHYDPVLREITPLIFEPNGVDMVISGHIHFYQRNYVNGIYHLLIASAGGGLYDPKSPSDPNTQKSVKSYSFGIFDVTPTTLTLKAYNQNGQEIDSLILPQSVSPTPTVTLTPTPSLLPPPQNLEVTCASSNTSVRLEWDAVSGATGYRVGIQDHPQVGNGTPTPPPNNVYIEVTSPFADITIVSDLWYGWWINAYDAVRSGVVAHPAPAWFKCPAVAPTSTPTPLPGTCSCPTGSLPKTDGNANCDTAINGIDFEIWRQEFWGTRTTKLANFNCNVDDVVDGIDFEIWRRNRN